MVEEQITLEQLQRVKRLVDSGNVDIASATLDVMIEGRKERINQFEQDLEDMFSNVPV
jgi:acetolactate synthase small subunit